jgi:hypothetical protein
MKRGCKNSLYCKCLQDYYKKYKKDDVEDYLNSALILLSCVRLCHYLAEVTITDKFIEENAGCRWDYEAHYGDDVRSIMKQFK